MRASEEREQEQNLIRFIERTIEVDQNQLVPILERIADALEMIEVHLRKKDHQ